MALDFSWLELRLEAFLAIHSHSEVFRFLSAVLALL